jgi:carbamoyl-phosphate synthase small subunit
MTAGPTPDESSAQRAAARLVLADGRVFEGSAIGARGRATGEVVFTTSMTGYQEALTDPSFGGQVLVMTYPLQGNYGVNANDNESGGIQVRGFVVRELTDLPSHWRSRDTLDGYLRAQGVPGISGIDTRALTRHLRTRGVLMGTVTSDESTEQALARLLATPDYAEGDYVASVSTPEPYEFTLDGADASSAGMPEAARNHTPQAHIAVIDLGVKRNIMRILAGRGCRVTAVPHTATADEIRRLAPDGVVLSPGPGDPMLLDGVVETARELVGEQPMLGICLGHQVVARVFGAKTYKLPFGHRGANHPVRELATGRVWITSQNHGFAVDGDGLQPEMRVAQMHLNDDTVEGLEHAELPIFTIQYHSEASPGPNDTEFLFDRFLTAVRGEEALATTGVQGGGA